MKRDNFHTPEQLAALAPDIAKAEGTQREIAEQFGVSRLAVQYIRRGLIFSHVTGIKPMTADRDKSKARRTASRKRALKDGKPHLRLAIDNTRDHSAASEPMR